MFDTNYARGRTALTLLVVLAMVASPVSAVTTATTAGIQQQSVSIEELQRPNAANGSSPYAGTNVTTSGTVTAVTAEGFYVQNGTGEYSGVYVYTGSAPGFAAGDVVRVSAPVTEYYGVTQLDLAATPASATRTGTAPVPAPTHLDTGAVGQEAYEGVLVEVTNVTVTATPGQYGEWAVDDGTGSIAVDDVTAGDATTPNATGATIDAVTGPVFYSFGAFKIQPTAVGTVTPPSDDGGNGSAPDGTTLTVVSYNDIQTAASNPTAMGKLAGAVNERRAAHDNPTLVVGGGDQVSPSSLSPVSNWTVPVEVLNVVDPAAEVVGNHDLDYGFEAVEEYSAASEFPWLLANVRAEDGSNLPGTKNYTIVERGDVRVGVVGLVDDAITGKTAVDFAANGYEVADFSTVGSRVATKLKEEKNVDVVVAAAHIGVGDSKQLARETEHIDVIVTGDDEIEYAPQTTSGAVIMEAEGRAAHLAELNLTVTDDSVTMQSGRLIDVTGNDAVPVNNTTREIVASARGEYLSEVIGRTTVPLDSTFAANYHDETAWGNLVTDAFRAETGAEVAVTNAGGIRGNFVIQPGNVTYDDVYTSLPFGNTLVTKRLSGAELKALLASQVVTLESPAGQQYGEEASVQVSGVTYEFVPHENADPVVRDVYVNGEPLRANATYNVTVNSYMAGWDDIADDPTVSRDYTLYGTVVAEYIEARGTVSPADTNRIRRVDREVGAEWLFQRGRGRFTPVHYDVPAAVQSVNASTFRVANATTGVVYAERARLDGDDLLLFFDTSEFRSLARHSTDLQMYGEYTDAEYDSQLVYFENAVLNGGLENWEVPGGGGDEDEEDDSDGDDGGDEEDGDDGGDEEDDGEEEDGEDEGDSEDDDGEDEDGEDEGEDEEDGESEDDERDWEDD